MAVALAAVIAVFLCGGPPHAEAANPLLPDRDFCRTSSFGSWRFGHLHAGIDLSTGGVEGAPVAAIDSCWVWRVSVRNEGYGKALYVRLPDGKIAVYGHLSAFAPRIEEAVEREQDLRGSYAVDIYNDPYAVNFAKGEIIAYSGASGWGPPHLHFELRSGMYDHFKINPFPDYIGCADSREPVIHAISVVPVGHGSSIDGDFIAVTVEGAESPDTLLISGDFGVMVSASDYTGCGRITSPVVYEARVDDVPVWRLDLAKFPFARGNFVWSLYDFDGTGRKYVRLFNPYRLDFNGFDIAHADTGYGGFAPGTHELSVMVADACGNRASATVPFRYGEFPAFEKVKCERGATVAHVEVAVSPESAAVRLWHRTAVSAWTEIRPGAGGGDFTFPVGPLAVEVRCRAYNDLGFVREGLFRIPAMGFEREGVFKMPAGGAAAEPELDLKVTDKGIQITARSPLQPSGLPVARIFEGIRTTMVPLQPEGEGLFRGYYVPGCGSDAIQARAVFEYGPQKVTALAGTPLACLERASSAILLTESFRLRIDVPRDMRPNVLLGYEEGPPTRYEGFSASLGCLIFEPPGTFFVEKAKVCLALREGSLSVKQGVFADRGGTASFRARADSTGTVCFETDFLEKLVVLEDRTRPEISDFEGRGPREDGRYVFTARASDEGSGIDTGTVRAFVDGQAAIAGIDPDTGIITGRTIKRLREGPHRFTLEVKDRMGNRASTEHTLSLK